MELFSLNAESRLWNHVTQQLRAWKRALQSPAHFKHLPPAEFTPTQHTEKRRQVKAYNWAIACAFQRNGEKALIGAIQGLE